MNKNMILASALSVVLNGPRGVSAPAAEEPKSHRERMQDVDIRTYLNHQARQRKNDAVKNKNRKGMLCVTDHGSVEAKLKKAFGGKRMRRVLNAERRAGRDFPEELRLWEVVQVPVRIDNEIKYEKGERELVRGVDFALVVEGGDMTLVLDGSIKDFRAESALSDGMLAAHLHDE